MNSGLVSHLPFPKSRLRPFFGAALSGVTTLFLAGCGASPSQPHDTPVRTPELTMGIDTIDGSLRAPCVKGRLRTVNLNRPLIDIFLPRDREDLASFLNVDPLHVVRPGGATPSSGNFRVLDPRIMLGQVMPFDPLHSYVLVTMERIVAEESLEEPEILGKDSGGGPAQGVYSVYLQRPDVFVRTCGDGFIAETVKGQAAYLLLKVRKVVPQMQQRLEEGRAQTERRLDAISAWLSDYPIAAAWAIFPAEQPVVEAVSYPEVLQRLQSFWSTPSLEKNFTYAKRVRPYREIEPQIPAGIAERRQRIEVLRRLGSDMMAMERCLNYATAVRDKPSEFRATFDLQDLPAAIAMADGYFNRRSRAFSQCEQGTCQETWDAGQDPAHPVTKDEADQEGEWRDACLSTLPEPRSLW